jgi:hypothetical protein
MKKSPARSVIVTTAVLLFLGASVRPAHSLESAGESSWYSPISAMMPLTVFKPTSATPSGTGQPRMLPMKGVHLMRGMRKAPLSAGDVPKLQFYGGPTLGSVKIQLVYWNENVANQDKLPGFFSSITQSPYFDWLGEYNTSTTKIGRGSVSGAYTDSVQNPSGQIEDGDIRTELTSLLRKGAIPQPDPNTLYMVYFPPGLSVDFNGSGSCEVFCAYHNTFLNNGQQVNYGVIPDQGGSCAGGCGADTDQFNNETAVSSHEMTEAVTDPAVGLVTGNTPEAPLGWYDPANGEIGDICNGMQAKVGGYTVQREWSNSRSLCVSSAQDSGSPAGQSLK